MTEPKSYNGARWVGGEGVLSGTGADRRCHMLGGGVLLHSVLPSHQCFCLNSEWLMPQWHRNQVIITAFYINMVTAAATSGRVAVS